MSKNQLRGEKLTYLYPRDYSFSYGKEMKSQNSGQYILINMFDPYNDCIFIHGTKVGNPAEC